MVTGIIVFLLIVAVIGSILYGRRLIKTEKIDTVFGNPERALGGSHWVIVGTCFLMLSWLYYSWDIAKSFYPKSANELCQVGKVTDSLLSLKYLFPIEERQHKSTDIIERENRNIKIYVNEIKNHPDLKDKDKDKFFNLLDKVQLTIPLLTSEKYLETSSINKINDLTNRIRQLTVNLPKDSYPPPLSSEEESKRIEALKKQLGWGATGEEVPTLPETKKGLKFHTAAKELNTISDEFFALRNHNPAYKAAMQEIKDEIREYKNNLNENQELEGTYAKDIHKLARRIEYASIFPPKTLVNMEQAIIEFDKVQDEEKGNLNFIDSVFFPGGTILSSGPTCSEDGPGRWLPKPSDTFRIFGDLLRPSVGFKYVPMLWYEMMDVSKIVGFILPDWIADILPGKYPVHTSAGKVEPNFKSKVLDIVTGEFELFKIPIPYGHIWVSFSIMIISARAGASGTQLSKIHAAHSLGASRWQILRHVIFPNSLPEILTGIRVAVGMCWGTLVAAEFLAGTTGIGFVENVARKYMQYEVIWITIFVMGMLGLLFDVTIRKIIDKTIPWRGKG